MANQFVDIPDTVIESIVSSLDRFLLDDAGRLKLLSAGRLEDIDPIQLKIWCVMRARYFLPTVESIEWLKREIGDRQAIEIAAGNGDLAHHLGIKSTDSYVQIDNAEVRNFYQRVRQQPTCPKPDTEKLDALEAVKKYKPNIVIAAWFTHKYDPKTKSGSEFGVNEAEIIANVKRYIHLGHESVHGTKPALGLKHEKIRFYGLMSRHERRDLNVVYSWKRS